MKHILIVEPYQHDRNNFRMLNKRIDYDDISDDTDVLYWIGQESKKYRSRNDMFNFKRILKYV